MVFNRKIIAVAAASLLAASIGATSARASFIFNTNAQNTSDGTVNGTATFDFISPGVLQLVLTNNEPGTAQGQSISSLNFTFSGFTITGLTSAIGTTIDFQHDTTVVNDNILTSGDGNWSGGGNSTSEGITALSGGQPFTMISGPNGSPNGNDKNFEPYVDTTATFLFSISGDNGTGTINSALFNFGTGANEHPATGIPDGGNGRTPEPASLGLLSVGALSLLARRRAR